MRRSQIGLAVVLVFAIFVLFAGMWGPTPFGIGDAPSTYDGTDEYGFPLRHKRVPSGECDSPGCSDPITSTPELLANGAIFVTAAAGAVLLSRRVLK